MSNWTTAAEVTSKVQSLWDRGRILSEPLHGSTLFPYAVRMRRPDPRAMVDRFDDVRCWIKDLEAGSKSVRGHGYEIRWAERIHRQLGRNRVPIGITIPTEADALWLINRQREAARFRQLVDEATSEFPELRDWMAQSPLAALEHATVWTQLLAVVKWFREHPRSRRYLRQINATGVDTKFIEAHKGIIAQLLDRALAVDDIDRNFSGAACFEQRYGLLVKPPLIRFRILDVGLRLQSVSDLTLPVAEFARLALPVRRVFITENEANGLGFPEVPESLVVFGLGYAVELLATCQWLKHTAMVYWGDIDTHGFAILDRLRASFPHVQSFLMDRETLLMHRSFWVREDQPYDGPLFNLTAEERALCDDLRRERLGIRVRLEQERVAFDRVEAAIARILGPRQDG